MAGEEETPLSLTKRVAAAKRDDAPRMRSHLSSIRRSMAFLSLLAGIGALYIAKDVLLPLSLAVMLSLILGPMVGALERLRLPTFVAAPAVVIMAAAALVACAFIVEPSITDMIDRAPQIARQVEEKLQPVRESLDTIQEAGKQLDTLTQVGGPAPAAAAAGSGLTPTLLQTVPNFLAQAAFVFILTLFALSGRHIYRKRLIMLSPKRETRLRVARILNHVTDQVSEYLLAITLINIGLGCATSIAFMIFGISDPLLWGVIFAIANYIPYLGPTGTMVICGVVQLVSTATIGEALLAPGIMFGLNLIESNIVTPWFVSRRIAVSSLAVFLAVALLIWLWGVAASFVAVPILILFNAIARHVPALEPIAYMLSGEERDSRQEAAARSDLAHAPEPVVTERWWRRMLRSVPFLVPKNAAS